MKRNIVRAVWDQLASKLRLWLSNRIIYRNLLLTVVGSLLVLNCYVFIQQVHSIQQAAISAYQQTELEIVRTVARSITYYVQDQIDQGHTDITALEQEILRRFVDPVHVLESGDAWIYAPTYVVFDRSSDFPDRYRDKSMAEIFNIQRELGASHYEAMTESVMSAQEGVGWYIWLPGKGKEIAAWTPVRVGEYVWTIGLSTPLPEILESSGARAHIRASFITTVLATTIILVLLLAWAYNSVQFWRADTARRESEQLLHDVFDAIQDGITVLDRDLNILRVNHAMRQRYPHVEEFVGRKCYETYCEHFGIPDKCPALCALERKCSQHIVHSEKRPDGTLAWFEVFAFPLFDAEGEIDGVVEYARDITEQSLGEQDKAQFNNRVRKQHQTLIRLSTHPALAEGRLNQALALITEAAADVLKIERVNVWEISPDGDSLQCLSSFERSTLSHTKGQTIAVEKYPRYFAALRAGIVLDVEDVLADPRTSELSADYWEPWDIRSVLESPVRLYGQMMGVICYEHIGATRGWQPDEIGFASQIGDLVAQTLLNDDIHSRAQRLAVVNQIARAVGKTLHLDDLLEVVYQQITSIFEADAFFIALYDVEREELDFRIQVDQGIREPAVRQPKGGALTAHVISQREPLLIQNFEEEREHLPLPELWGTMRFPLSWLGVPMQIGDQVIGVVCVQAYKPYAYGEDELLLLDTIADQVAVALDNARLYRAVEQELNERRRAEAEREHLLVSERQQRLLAETLTEVTLSLTSHLRYEVVLDEVLQQSRRIVSFETANIALVEGDVLRVTRRQGYEQYNAEETLLHFVQPLAKFVLDAEVVQTQRPLVIPDTREEPRWLALDKTSWIRSCLIVPICLRDQVLGLLRLDHSRPHAFSDDDARRLQPLVNAAAIAIENARLVEGLEAEVAARTAEIRTEKEKLEAILSNVGDAILVADADRTVQYINKGYTLLTGYTPEEVLGKPANSVGAVIPEQVEQLVLLSLNKGDLWHGEVTVHRKNGRAYDAALTIAPVYDVEGHLVAYVANHRDISRLKELERARSQFIVNVSHQLRTPVATLKTQIYAMQRRTSFEDSAHYLNMMEAQIDQLGNLVQDILKVAALDSGEIVRVWDSVSMAEIVTHMITVYQSQAAQMGLVLDILPLPLDLPVIFGDQERLTQALDELMENALTFTPSGGHVTLEVEAREAESQSWVTFTVRDTGPGIAPDEREHLFDRFFRGRLVEAGQIPGTGLGLNLVYNIIQAHGGRITVDSEVGQGSGFTVWLPCVSGEADG